MLSDQDIFNRYQQKQAEFAKLAEVSLIGHSLFDMWCDQAGGTPMLAGKTVANLGLSGTSTRQYLDVIVKPQRITHLGKQVFVFFGVNDIVKEPNYSPKQVMDWLDEIHQALYKLSPNSTYYLLEATPVNNISTVDNPEIIHLNQYIKQNCLPQWKFIETRPHFMMPSGKLNVEYCVDGLHFNAKGYQILEKILTKILEQS